MRNIDLLINSLSKTKFRGSFHLNDKMIEYCKNHGYRKIESDAYDFINARLKPAFPKNDGKQTPTRQVHPVFIAQHATGCCCRECLERIHNIAKGHDLTCSEVDYIVKVIMMWITLEVKKSQET